ncbi:MAG: hypothetical protein ABIV94_06650 [Acidimicrobiales bacterium]
MPSNRDQLLKSVYQNGDRYARRRRQRFAGLGAAGVLALALSAAALTGQGGRRTVSTASDLPSTYESSTTSTTVHPVTRSDDTTTTSAPSVPTSVPTPTTPTTPTESIPPDLSHDEAPPAPLVCRNSVDPACGNFYYDWTGPNRPATITLSASPPQPRVGEPVTITVTFDDPDGEPPGRCWSFFTSYDDITTSGDPAGENLCGDHFYFERHGPWDPPPPWHWTQVYTTTYGAPGIRRVRYWTEEAGPGPCPGACPWQASADLLLTVAP